jgi:H+/Cl- antiporter ClcA
VEGDVMNKDSRNVDALEATRTQIFSFAIGAALALLTIASFFALLKLAAEAAEKDPSLPILLLWAGVGGFFGGAARAIFRFISQLNLRDNKEVRWRLRRWFLYLLKPFVGLAGGVLLFLLVNLGIVGLFGNSGPKNEFLHVALTSCVGGLFFEDVFAQLQRIFPSDKENASQKQEKEPPKKSPERDK